MLVCVCVCRGVCVCVCEEWWMVGEGWNGGWEMLCGMLERETYSGDSFHTQDERILCQIARV